VGALGVGVGRGLLVVIEQAAAESARSRPFCLLVAVGKIGRRGFAIGGGEVTHDTRDAALQAEAADLPADVDLIATIRSGVLIWQRLIGRRRVEAAVPASTR
jgi:hypothetical protein